MRIAGEIILFSIISAMAIAACSVSASSAMQPPLDGPRDVIEYLLVTQDSYGAHQELHDRIRDAPAAYAPILREYLLSLPDSLEEYLENPEIWSISDHTDIGMRLPRTYWLLPLVVCLGREHAEPILREFYNSILPLSITVDQLAWEAEEARNRGEELADAVVHVRSSLRLRFGSAAGSVIATARRLHSPIFIDDAVAFLQSDRPAERARGANMAAYVLDFAEERPDAVEFLHNAAAVLAASDNPRDREAARSLSKQLDEHARTPRE